MKQSDHDVAEYDVAIVGGGPAGLSAAIMLGRCRRRVVLYDGGRPRNQAAVTVNGFLGSEGVSPIVLRKRGREQAAKYGVTLIDMEVAEAKACEEGCFTLRASDQSVVTARKVLFATGVKDELPDIPGLTDFYGRSVHHCPYCDGWEHRDRRLVALGDGDSVVELALALLAWSAHVTACTNGKSLSAANQNRLTEANVGYRRETIERLEGKDGQLTSVIFRDGPPLECDALFFSANQSQHCELPQNVGCDCNSDGLLRCSNSQRSDVRGVFVAGDASSDTQFAIVAAAQGAIAATAINEELHAEDLRAKAIRQPTEGAGDS